MKISDITAFFAGLDQDAEVLVASYYYDDREGFTPEPAERLSEWVKRPQDTEYNQHYTEQGNVYLIDHNYSP